MRAIKIISISVITLLIIFGFFAFNRILNADDPCGLFGGSAEDAPGCNIVDVSGGTTIHTEVFHDYYPEGTPRCVEDDVFVRLEFLTMECGDAHIVFYAPMFLDFDSRTDEDNEERYLQDFCFVTACGSAQFRCEHDTDGYYWWDTGGWTTEDPKPGWCH